MSDNGDLKVRGSLRKDFLCVLQHFAQNSDSTSKITLCSGAVSIKSKVIGFDRELLQMVVQDFSTPTHQLYDSAVLRLTDVDSVALSVPK